MNRIRPKKSLGQHFLHDPNIIRKIADAIPPEAGEGVILEIGPGTGLLTAELLKRFERVRAVEIDRRVIPGLREQFPTLDIVEGDILRIPIDRLTGGETGCHVVGNLPYYITSQILFRILEWRSLFRTATIMMQKEVAERLVAGPGTKQYGILSVQVQLMSRPERLFDVSPGAFTPRPKVDSSVVQLHFDRPPLQCGDQQLKKVVRTAFQQRRKKLSNALSSLRPLPDHPDLSYDKRAEAWPPSHYEKLTALLEQDGTPD